MLCLGLPLQERIKVAIGRIHDYFTSQVVCPGSLSGIRNLSYRQEDYAAALSGAACRRKVRGKKKPAPKRGGKGSAPHLIILVDQMGTNLVRRGAGIIEADFDCVRLGINVHFDYAVDGTELGFHGLIVRRTGALKADVLNGHSITPALVFAEDGLLSDPGRLQPGAGGGSKTNFYLGLEGRNELQGDYPGREGNRDSLPPK